ncbi:MAG: lycopene cyclase [Parcubacteria group bacterium Gr01-1014_46]|nr:MAG: lycopene cyclase [Parcubacteria group bacterium Gr01-1014_46]
MKYEYLLILLFFLLVALFLEWKYRIHLYNSKKERLIITFILFFIGIVWDNFAVWRGHWSFPGNGLLGINVGFIPVEEYLFFLIMPFWAITMYKILTRKIK